MRGVFSLVAATAGFLVMAGCHHPEQPVAMPAADLANVSVRSISFYKNRFQLSNPNAGQVLQIRFSNITNDEIASISGDWVGYDEAGKEISRTPVVFNSFLNGSILYEGSLLPQSAGAGKQTIKIEPPAHSGFDIKSATYFAKGDDLSQESHMYAAIERLNQNKAVEDYVDKNPSALQAMDPKTGTKLIHIAAGSNNVELTRYLADKGVDIDERARGAGTPVLIALDVGANDAALYLIDKGAKLDNLIRQPKAIEVAASRCSGKVIEALIAMGQDPNDQPLKRANPLQIAAEQGNKEVALALLSHGVDINYTDKAHTPAIFMAVIADNIDMVDFLIKHGANVNQTAPNGWTPIMVAGGRASGEMVHFLISKGANVAAVDQEGKNALYYADQVGNQGAAAAITESLKKY